AEERECRDSSEALQGARASRHFQRAETGSSNCGRDAKVLLNPVRVRSVLEEVDSSALAVLSAFRGEGRGLEAWLKSLPLARGSKAKIRNLMSALYSHAIRWEWTEKNPIKSVRQSAKRMRVPDVLAPEEITALLGKLPEPLRT